MTEPSTGKVDFIVGSEGFETAYKVFGDLNSKTRPLIGIPVIFYDQLGCGLSTHLPEKPREFWTEEFMKELDNVTAHFKNHADFDLAGHSWGGILAVNYVISRNPRELTKLILADAPTSTELWSMGTRRTVAGISEGVRRDAQKHELTDTTDSMEYQAGIQQFNEKHQCRVQPWPQDLLSAFEALEADPTVYSTMHDDAQDVGVVPFFERIPRVKWVQYAKSSHMPFFEEQ
ncbi:Alpha/Beta hydrolase protein [Mycena capillaripes]|nr:Alpha/Beta hydrolase protein [Mycena capillaripes]